MPGKITSFSGREHSAEEPLHLKAGAVVADPPHALIPSKISVSTTAAATKGVRANVQIATAADGTRRTVQPPPFSDGKGQSLMIEVLLAGMGGLGAKAGA